MNLSRLDPWLDPEDLIEALVDLPREQLAEAKPKLIPLAKHADDDVRVHALRRLFVHLKDPSERALALHALREDAAAKVRRVAAHAISATTSAATIRSDTSELLQALIDPSEDLDVRGAAYEALLLIHARRDFPPVNRDIDLAKDVDWSWIRLLQAGVGTVTS